MAKIEVSYERVGVPRDLYEAVAKHIRKNPRLGYVSVSEFIRSAFRDYILSRNAPGYEEEA